MRALQSATRRLSCSCKKLTIALGLARRKEVAFTVTTALIQKGEVGTHSGSPMITIGTHSDAIASYSLELVAESPGGTKQKAARRISRAMSAFAGGPAPTLRTHEPVCSHPAPRRCDSRTRTRGSADATPFRCCRTLEPSHVPVHMLPMKTPRVRPYEAVQAAVPTWNSGEVWSAQEQPRLVWDRAVWGCKRRRTWCKDLMRSHSVLRDWFLDELHKPPSRGHAFKHPVESGTVVAPLHDARAGIE